MFCPRLIASLVEKKKEKKTSLRAINSSAASVGSDCKVSRARLHACPTDGSPLSQRAAHHICFQASVQSKELLLLKPEDTPPLTYASISRSSDSIPTSVEQVLVVSLNNILFYFKSLSSVCFF